MRAAVDTAPASDMLGLAILVALNLADECFRARADQAKAAEANARLSQEITALRARLAEAESTATEITALRDEREVIRTRVAEMLEQLEAI